MCAKINGSCGELGIHTWKQEQIITMCFELKSNVQTTCDIETRTKLHVGMKNQGNRDFQENFLITLNE